MTLECKKIPPYVVFANELPVSCPRPNQALWNAHPRVYLPLEETGYATCPYCGTEYTLSLEPQARSKS